MEREKTIVQQANAESWLTLEIEQNGKMTTFRFPSLEFASVSAIFNNVCSLKTVSTCDFILANEKTRIVLADKQTYDAMAEAQREAIARQRFGGL